VEANESKKYKVFQDVLFSGIGSTSRTSLSVPMGHVGHLGLGPSCIVAIEWIRGAASNREKTSNDRIANQLRLIHFFNTLLYSSFNL
jgi:hypothetical protein